METPKSTGGRPAHHPTAMHRRLVETLTSRAISQVQICLVLGISEKTLRLRYRNELNRGASKLEAALIMHLHRIACGREETALRAVKFILMARFGWSQYVSPRV